MNVSLPILAALLLIRFVNSEAQYQRARRVGSELRFPAGVAMRMILGLGVPLCLYGTYATVLIARQTREWWLPVICLTFALLALVGDLGEIRVKQDGVELHRLLGIRQKRIRWEGASASFSHELREVVLVGSDGTCITHSQYHVGQEQFVFELRRHGVHVFE